MSLLKTWKRRILRSFARKNSTPGVFDKTLKKIATGIAGLGFLATSNFAAGQVAYTDIQAHDAGNTTVYYDPGNSGNYNYHIVSQKISGTNAFNSFSSFNLATNDTANFYLPNGTANLINFVKSRIEIDGTVNAIKDHKIGGNLFFLSSQGLVLGSSGVVNCGAFYAMTPTSEFMDKFVGGDYSLNIDGNAAEIAQITSRKFVNHNGVVSGDGVPLNSDGSIVIGGRINAVDNVSAHAGNVTLESGARIDTGVTDFSALVNTSNIWKQDENGSFFSQTDLVDVNVSGLAMTTNEDGNVELVAVADNVGRISSTSKGSDGFSSYIKATSDAKVTVKGTVNAKRNASFEAVAVNGTLSGKETIVQYGENKEVKTFVGADSISSVNATVEVDTTARINADNDINMRAFATNVYKSSTSPTDLGIMIVGMVSPVNISAQTAVVSSKAEVKVKQGAIVTSKKNIDIKASSETDVIVGASTSIAKIKQTSGGVAAGVVFAEVSSDANVVIDGSLNAGTTGDATAGDITINALSDNSLDATAASKTANDKAAISTGIVIGKVTNRSDIKVNNSASVNAKRAVKGKATNRSDVATTAIVETGDDSYAGVAINFTDFDSSAKVSVNSSINAPGNIDLSAYNLVLQNRSTAKGTVGHTKISQAVANLQSSIVSCIFSLSKLTSKFTGPIKDQSTKFRAAGAIVVNRGSHDAGLTIGSDVKLTSGNDLILKSSSVVQDLFIQADSVARSKMNTADGAKASVSAGIIYSDISQDSTVKVADASYNATTGNGTVLTGKTVDISSEVKVEYNRVKRMIAAIEDAIATLKISVSDSTQLSMINSVETAYQTIKNKFSAVGSEGLSKAENITGFIDALTSLSTMTTALNNLITGENRIVAEAAKIVTSAADFAFYNNFLNTAVSSAVKGANEENTTDIGFAGAVGLTDFKANSNVLIGRNVTIQSVNPATSVSDSIKVAANTDIDMISAAGYLIPSSGSKAMGGTYFSQDFNSSAKVMVPEGVNLIGGSKDISISATSDAKAVVGGFAAAMAGAGIQGMFTHLTGVSDASVNFDNEASVASTKNLKLNALNNTRIINFAGSVMISSSVGVAAGFAINDFVKDSIVLIGDIDKKYQDYLDEKAGIDKATTADSARSRTDAKIAVTGQIDAQAKSKGGFIAAGVAGGITKNDDSGAPGITDKISGKANDAESKVVGTINSISGKFSNITSELSNKTKTSSTGTHTNPSVSLSVAGSGGLNFIDTNTVVDISGMTLDLGGVAGSNLNAIAVNNTDVMAFAGTAGIMYQTATKDTSGKSVGIAGAVGLNMLKNKTEAVIKNSTVNNADDLNVFAVNGGTDVAAALGLQVSKNSGNAAGAFTMGGSVSLNNIDNTVNAELNNTNVTGKSSLKTDVKVAAYESDLQITGGVQVTVGQQKGAFGAAVNVSKIDNNVSAKITGGTFNMVNDVAVAALQAIAQINGAVTAGIVTGTDGTVSLMGAMIYNETNNNLKAEINEANITASGKVSVNARDYFLGENETGFGQILDRADSGVSSFVDTDGGDYYDVDASNEADGELDTSLKDQIKKGSLIVSGAMAISVADTAVGAGLSINDIDNNFSAEIKNSTINAGVGTVETNAKSDTFMVSAAGGVAVSKKNAAAGGSVIWNDISSKVNSGTVNSVITTGNYLSKAGNDSRIIGIAGQVSAGKGPAIGLAFTYNKIVNNSNAFCLATKVTGPGYSVVGSQFLVNAINNGEIMNLALSVPVSNQVGIGGSVAINDIDNNTGALVDNRYVDDAGVTKTVSGISDSNFENFSTIAAESSDIKSISGTLGFGGEASIGGAVAYNEINGKTAAAVNNVTVGGKNVTVKSTNDADIWTLASGCGGAGEVAVQGAAATSEISRTISAGMNNVSETKNDSSIDVVAESTGEINSNATVVSIGKSVGVGAGVVVNRMSDDVTSSLTGGVLAIKDLDIRSKATQTIRTIGVAGAGGAYAGVSGSVAVNVIKNNVSSFIDGNANIVAEDNIGVVAQSDETLLNYSGVVAGGVAGVGAALSVNDIQGNTRAYVENATVQAKGLAGSVSLNNGISDTSMNSGFIDDSTLNVKYTLEKQRAASTKKGLVVDSSATHTLKSFVANAAGGGIAVTGTVNVSRIAGETSARVSNTRINNGVTGGDVSINSGDYANLSGFVGSVGISGGSGVGMTSDSGIVNRTTSAKMDGTITGSTAKDVAVTSEAKTGISAIDAGISLSGLNSVAGTVSVNVLKSNTEAVVNNSNLTVNSLLVKANHWARTSIVDGTASVGGYVGVGGAVGINDIRDKVKAEVTSSNVAMKANGSGKFEVQAINQMTLKTIGAAVAGGMAGLAGNVGLNIIETDVLANVKNSNMTNRATDVTVKADDSLTLDANLGTVAVGAVGAGVSAGVSVLDGKTRAIVDGSKLLAVNSIDITAREVRNVTQNAFTAAAGIGGFAGNVIYISSGNLLINTDEDGASNVRDAVSSAEKVNSGNISESNGALTDAEKLSLNADGGKLTSSEAGRAATAVAVGKIDATVGSTLDSQGTINVKAVEDSNFSVIGGSGAVGMVAAGGSACFIDVNRNVAAKLTNATLVSGKTTDVNAKITGSSDLDMYQGSIGYLGAGTAAYGRIGTGGKVFTELTNSSLTSTGNILISADDTTSATAESYGLTAGMIAAGALITQIDNDTSAAVTLTGNTISSGGSASQVNIKAERAGTLTAKSLGGAAGLFAAGTGIGSTIKDAGSATVTSTGGTYTGKSKISFDATSKPTAVSEAKSAAISGLVSAGVSVAKSELSGTTEVSVSGTNSFNAPEVAFSSTNSGKNTLLAEGLSGGFLTSFGYNLSDAQNNSIVKVLIGDSTFINKATKLALNGTNIVTQNVETRGLNIGGIVASGNNKAKAESNTSTKVELTGNSTSAREVGSIDIKADSSSIHDIAADGNGGGLISVDGLSAYAINKMTTLAEAVISGKWKITDKLNLFAAQNDTVNMSADSMRAALIGYSGTKAENTINSTTKVAIADNSAVDANGNIEFQAKNTIDCNDDGANSASGGGYGGIVVNGAYSDSSITSTTEAKIGKNASLVTNGDIYGEALTDAEIHNRVLTEGAGMVANPLAHSYNTVSFNNKLLTGTNSVLKTVKPGKNINLAASDNLTAVLTADSDMQGGLGGYSEAKTSADISRNNTVDISGDIYSANDARLYTDADARGKTAVYTLTATADAYNKHSAVAVAKATLDSTTNQNNKININSGADINTIRHIALHSGTGKMAMTETASEYTWYSSSTTGGYTSTASGLRSKNLVTGNTVTVNGSLVSGINNYVELKITGLVDLLGLVTGSTTSPTVTSTVSQYAAGVTTGIMDYGNELFTRYQEICGLIAEYAGTVAGAGYLAEKTRLLAEMEKYGLYDPATETVIGGLYIQYLSLPDMVCSGGNVSIDADKVAGTGSIDAKGAPQIVINNDSNLYMKVNDLSIIDYGGELIYNSLSLGNTAKTVFTTLSKVQTSDSSSARIAINENWNGTLNVVEDGVNKTLTPITNIELNGNISNPQGKVVIDNRSGDIVMQGATAETGATITAGEIEMKASEGAISQGFSDGILNIGGTPEEIYKDFATVQETLINGNESTSVSKTSVSNSIDESRQQGTWIAGGSVYLSATNINVNGLIQSGYSEYKMTLSTDAQNKINLFDKNYTGQNITPDMLQAYKLNTGGVKKDSAGKWYFEVQAYYNPQTKQVILEDIDPKGGRVYLTGRIASTGNGKILAFDGSSEINLVNQTSRPITLGKINLGKEAGLISITDLEKNNITEFRRDSTSTRTIGATTSTISGPSAVYTPKTGQYYNWTTGKTVAAVENYYKKVDFRLWGGYTKNETTIHEYESEENLLSSSSGEQNRLPGTYIGTLPKSGTSEYVINYDNDVDYYSSYFDKWITYSNAIKSRGSEHYKWGSTVGKILTFQHSIKADHNINIGFIGSTSGGKVNVSSAGNVNMTGDIAGHAGTSMTISATNGSIQQTGGRLIGDHLNLTAKSGIGSDGAIKHLGVSDNGSLSAVSTTGNINIVSKASSGKQGNLELGKVTTGGDVKLTVDGSISRSSAADALVKGRRIDLVSNNGSIGKTGSALWIQAGQTPAASGDTMSASINAKARNGIYLEQTSGDMRLGRIESETGDVELKVTNGSFDNVLPVVDNSNDRKGDDLVEKWISMGLINADGTDNSAAVKTRVLADYENSVKSEFASFSAQKTFYAANPTVTKTASYNELLKKYGSYSSAAAYLTAKKADASSDYYKIANNTYGWTKDNLLYALQKSIMNPTSGSTGSINRPANVKGKNITLTAVNGGIGKDGTPEELSIANLSSNLDVLKKLAGAEASDITWKEAEGKAIINNKTAIGIEMIDATGGLTATAKNNIYIAAATEDPIYLKNVNAGSSDIRLLGKDGIFNLNSNAASVNVKGKDLIIEGGAVGTTSAIGTTDKAIVTDLSGKLTARAEGYINIFQNSANTLNISALYGGGDVKIRSFKNMGSVNTGITFDDSGYVNALGKLTLVSDSGNIGEDGKGIRLLTDNLDSVDATAGGSIFIKGLTNASSKPALNIGKVKTASTGAFKVVSDTAAVNFSDAVEAGTMDVNTTLVSQDEAKSSIKAGTLNSVTTAGFALDSLNNQISNAAISNNSGSILLKNKSALKLLGITNSSTASTDKLIVNNTANLTFGGAVDAKNIEIAATAVSQDSVSSIKTDNLNVATSDGMNLQSLENQIKKATLSNSKNGNISLGNKIALTLAGITNSSTSTSSMFSVNSTAAVDFAGAVNAKNVSVKALSVSQNEKTSSIVTDKLEAGAEKGFSLDSANNQIAKAAIANKTSGSIYLKNKVNLELLMVDNNSVNAADKVQIVNTGSLAVNGTVRGPKVDFSATSISQGRYGSVITPDLNVTTVNGLSLNNGTNQIAQATLKNTSTGDIELGNSVSLKLMGIDNLSTAANSRFFIGSTSDVTFGAAVNALNVFVKARSVAQDEAASKISATQLSVETTDGMSIDSQLNNISAASLRNKTTGGILFRNKPTLKLLLAENNSADSGAVVIENTGSISLNGNVIGKRIDLKADSITQDEASSVVKAADLLVSAVNGISIDSTNNEIGRADLANATKGNVELKNKTDLILSAVNKSTSVSDKMLVNCAAGLMIERELNALNIDLKALALTQNRGSRIITDNLSAVTQNGMLLSNIDNQIKQASLSNSSTGRIEFGNSVSLKLAGFSSVANTERERDRIQQIGNLEFAGNVSSGYLEVNADTITQNESSSAIKAGTLQVMTREGMSLDSLNNEILTAGIENRRGDTVLKNKTALQLKYVRGGDSLTIGNNGNITALGDIEARMVTINLIGSLNSNYRLTAANDLTVNATGNITARTVRARNVKLTSGVAQSSLALNLAGKSDLNLRLHLEDAEAATDSRVSGSAVNQIAESGGINVHDLLAEEDVYGLTENGDIMLANIGGKRVTLIINNDQGRVNVDQAALGESMNVTAGEFKGGLLEHTETGDNLKLGFTGSNGRYMNDVTIDKITSGKGVQVDNLDSITARINADCDNLQLNSVDLLGLGQFANNQTSVVVTGSENSSSEIKFAGSGVSVTRRAKQRSEMSLTDRVAGIFSSNFAGMGKDVKARDNAGLEGAGSSEDMIDYSAVSSDNAVSGKLASHGNRVFLTDSDEEEREMSADVENETSETEIKD